MMSGLYISRFTKYVAVPQHLLGLFGIGYYLIFKGEWSWLLWTYLAWVVIGVFGVSMTYHKIYAHRSFEVKPVFEPLMKFLTLMGMLSGQGSPISYAAVHRCYHHPNSDVNERDPHSPREKGLWHAYYGWHFSVFRFTMNGVRDLTKNKFLSWCHKNYYSFFMISYLIIGLIDLRFLVFCVVFPGLMHVHQMNILNSLSHRRWFGYRNYETEDDSVNNWIFGILTWGTGFHNNHHAHQERFHNQVKWYEFDPFRWIVPLLKK
ncbi:MAG: fatty acid desaturase [Bdellovibrionales bacterium]|nr:fatty acid desaturase [Bdellovibrionales bacterium]NQZ18374.1 fatty acid desaturase [Bdellovibrionales bacterium]